MRNRVMLLSGVVACVPACGSLVDVDYSGEALLRLQGVVASSGRGAEIRTRVGGAVLWQSIHDTGATSFTRLPLDVQFPTFWIDVLSVPRDEVLFRLGPDEPAIGEAYFHLVKPGTGAQPLGDDFLATDYEHALIYVADGASPGGLTASYLGAPLAAGFHVVTVTPTVELTGPQQILVDRCVALTNLSEAQAQVSCTAQHSYRLDPTPGDLATLLEFTAIAPDA